MWKCRTSYGNHCCSLHDSYITDAAFENKVLYMRFEGGIVLLPKTWVNPSKSRSYRSDAALVAITTEDSRVSIPQDAVDVRIYGENRLFGKNVGCYRKNISVDALTADIHKNPDKYRIVDVYSSEDGGKMFFRGMIHEKERKSPFYQQDCEFAMTVQLKNGASMRYFWNELNRNQPV